MSDPRMDLHTLVDALGGRDLMILSVVGRAPDALSGMSALSNITLDLAGTSSEATRRLGKVRYDLLVITDDDEPDDLKDLIKSARSSDTVVVVQGDGARALPHLRAILAGADSYTPNAGIDAVVERVLRPTEKPLLTMTHRLKGELKRFGHRASGDVLRAIQSGADAATESTTVDQIIASATREVIGQDVAGGAAPAIERVLHDTLEASLGEPAAPGSGSGSDELYWNVRFQDSGILRNSPHVVAAGGSYPFETALEPAPGLVEFSQVLPAAELLGRKIVFELTVSGGFFTTADNAAPRAAVVSDAVDCTIDGTSPFGVTFVAGEAGAARITAMLLVDGGSVARQTVDLVVIGDGPAPPRERETAKPTVIPRESITERSGADLYLHLTGDTAMLHVDGDLMALVHWDRDLTDAVSAVTRNTYARLCNLSKAFPARNDLTLIADDADRSTVALAAIGSQLWRSVFTTWPAGSKPPRALRDLAEQVAQAGRGSHTDLDAPPPQLQVIADGYQLPWGVLYDRPLPEHPNHGDVDPYGFWGMRFDIYRDVVPTAGRRARRGATCELKPIVGDQVPQGANQLDFLNRLAPAPVGQSVVQTAAKAPAQVRQWAERGDPSDLLYLFCHAIPADPVAVLGAKPESSALGFGVEGQDNPRITLRQLRTWWKQPRPANPVVILNACASGQVDSITGAPFVKFFTETWDAQAFIGTDWAVQAQLADGVGRALLTEIYTNRRTLRAALRSVINAAAEQGNYFPLMYAIFGPSNIEFS